MKIQRFSTLIVLFVLGSLLLTGCGGALVNDWPGLSVGGNNVYLSYQGAVYAINAGNGSLSWQFPKEVDAGKPFYAPPAVLPDGSLVVGNYGKTLHAIDSAGNSTAEFTTESGNFVATPLVLEDTVLAPASDDTLYALDRSLKTVKWKFKSTNMLWATPVSDGTQVFVPALDHHLYALDLADGSKVWSTDLGSALQTAPVMGEDGTLYVTTIVGEVVAVDPENGNELWRTATGSSIWATAALHEDTLYVGNNGGKVTAVSAADGSVRWQKEAGSPVIGGGAVIENAVVFPTEGGKLIAYAFADGGEVWNSTINGKLYSTPVIAGDKLVVAVMEGDKQLQAFGLDGTPSWPWSNQ